ncbi:MAG: NADPH:quinone reductase [Bathelium mastoideum]|nr:MAG: NADPH:quinone reductase [Bathelium mastoideum]
MASIDIPKTMSGVIINKTGGTEVLEYKTDLPVPQPKEGEVLVKNDYVGVNFIDTYFRTGLYPAPGFPYTLGREGEGTLVAAGPNTPSAPAPGTRVVYMGQHAYAQYTAVLADSTIAVPAGIPETDAAAGFLQGLTALTLIREAHHVNKGDWVLVHAAAGGTGLWLCQLLRLVGAHTIGTASTPEKRELAKKNGAEVVVDYAHEDLKARVMELTGGKGVVAAFDGVGKATFDLSMDCLARKGSMISFGNASGAVPPLTISRLSAKNVRLMRPTLFQFLATREELEQYATELLDMMAKSNIDVRIHEIYPLKDVVRAHHDLEGRKSTGKLLLKP